MRRARVSVVVVAGLALFSLGSAPDAGARMRCSYAGPPQNLLTVRATHDALGVIRRRGDEILVREFLDPPQRCRGGTPSVLNTDKIRIFPDTYSSVDLNLRGGAFAPGATAEEDGAPEIEVEFEAHGLFGDGGASGTPGADEFQWVAGGPHAGLNLNPTDDQDADVTVTGRYAFMSAAGAEGNDRITPAPAAQVPEPVYADGGRGDDYLAAPTAGSILVGGPGDDRLIGARSRDHLYGGRGRDRLIGTGGQDRLDGGRGRDLLVGGPARDRIYARDSRRDVVRCGAGLDRVEADPQDRLHGCEVIRP